MASYFPFIMVVRKVFALLYCLLLVIAASNVRAQSVGPLRMVFHQQDLQPGDTLLFEVYLDDTLYQKRAITLNVTIEDVHRTQRWKLRYPMIEGYAAGAIKLPAGITQDHYAFHCSVQPAFFDLLGRTKTTYDGDSIRYTLITGDRQLFSGELPVSFGRQFRLGRRYFEGTGIFFFANPGRRKDKVPPISLVTPLDSAYRSVADSTALLLVGRQLDETRPSTYRFLPEYEPGQEGTLDNVTVTAQRRNELMRMEKEYIQSPMFKNDNGFTFPGDDPALLGTMNALNYLMGRVPGLMVQNNGQGDQTLTWRGAETVIYLDEMLVDASVISSIAVSNIAFIKAYRPPFFGAFGGGAGGAVAVYTKKGSDVVIENRLRFVVNGYTPAFYTLPVR